MTGENSRKGSDKNRIRAKLLAWFSSSLPNSTNRNRAVFRMQVFRMQVKLRSEIERFFLRCIYARESVRTAFFGVWQGALVAAIWL